MAHWRHTIVDKKNGQAGIIGGGEGGAGGSDQGVENKDPPSRRSEKNMNILEF